MRVAASPTYALALALVCLSALLLYSDSPLSRCALAVTSAWASVLVTLERTIPRARILGHLEIEKDVVIAGEPFKVSIDLSPWVFPLTRVLRVELAGSRGVLVLEASSKREGDSLRTTLMVFCMVGSHRIEEVALRVRLAALATTLDVVLRTGTTVRAVPRVGEAPVSTSAGAPYDVGLSSVGRPGPGTQFYMNREYRPGDDLKRVDWKASSRTGKLVVKTFEREAYRRVLLVLPVSSGFLERASRALDVLVGETLRLAAELVRRGAEVAVSVVSGTSPDLPAYVRVRSTDDLADLADYFSRIRWSGASRDHSLEYRSALWTSFRLLAEGVVGRSVVVYLGAPESEVDLVAGRIVADLVKRMGHEPVFALVSPELLRLTHGEASAEDIVQLARTSRVASRELSSIARIIYFGGDDLLGFLLRALSA